MLARLRIGSGLSYLLKSPLVGGDMGRIRQPYDTTGVCRSVTVVTSDSLIETAQNECLYSWIQAERGQ